MPDRANKLAVVIPTLGRPMELRRMLKSLAEQSVAPDRVIIIDEGEDDRDVADGLAQLKVQFLALKRGSTSAKRNLGASVVSPDVNLIAFLDDDIVLEPRALEAMFRFWETAPPDVGAASFNLANRTPFTARRLKSLRITRWLGLYSTRPGEVLRSGFHTRIDPLPETTYVSWLMSGVLVIRKQVLKEFTFDPFFEGYGYLEDLDFTYRVGKRYKLAVVSDARFYNYPSSSGRESAYTMGKKEVINRLYFVRKNNELSGVWCFIALIIQMLMNLSSGILARESKGVSRARGNCVGLFSVLFRGLQPVRRDSEA